MTTPPDRYAVTGHPIEHSMSPFIHRWFACETGQALRYDAIHSPPGGFAEVVRRFRAEGGRGLNVTLPFKEEAAALAGVRTPRAERAGAVNTLTFAADGTVYGDNTDGVGLVRDLRDNRGVPIAARSVLMVGAGGGARGVLPALLAEGPARLVVVNRSPARAQALAALFEGEAAPVRACGFGGLGAEPFDIVVNATSGGLSGERAPPVPISALRPGGACYDMVYAREPTAFLRWARAAGARAVIDGTGMLVEQGAEAFRQWRGVRPPTQRVIEALRAELRRG